MFKYYRLSLLLSFLSFISFSTLAANVDPTKPLTLQSAGSVAPQQGVVSQNDLVLEAIVHGKKIHTVVINNKELHVGDYIGEYKLVAVNDDSAVLRSQEERIKLYVFSGVIVK